MIVIPKDDVNIIASNIAQVEAGIVVWDVATSYAQYDEVQLGDTVYECLVASSTGDDPLTKPLIWNPIRKTNYYAMFDATMNTQTTNTDSITYSFTASDVDTLALFNLEATTVRVVVTNTTTSSVVYDTTKDVTTRDVSDWVDWTYNVAEYVDSVYFQLFPVFTTQIDITISNVGSVAKCGHLVYGRSKKIGLSLINPAPISSIRNVISKTKDKNGNVITTNSKTYKRVVVHVVLDNTEVDKVQRRLDKLNGVPALFVGDERDGGYTSLMTYGFHKDFDMPISVVISKYTLEIEGVI